eukprot:6890258-Prymnesium_polylepis.2
MRGLSHAVCAARCHRAQGRLADLYAFREVSSARAILFYDEATTLRCVKGLAPESSCRGNFGASMAYNRVAREGLVKVCARGESRRLADESHFAACWQPHTTQRSSCQTPLCALNDCDRESDAARSPLPIHLTSFPLCALSGARVRMGSRRHWHT